MYKWRLKNEKEGIIAVYCVENWEEGLGEDGVDVVC